MKFKPLLIYSLVITGFTFNQYLDKERYLIGLNYFEAQYLNSVKISNEQHKLIQDLYESKSKFKDDYQKCDQQLYLTEKKVRYTLSNKYKSYLTSLIASTIKSNQ